MDRTVEYLAERFCSIRAHWKRDMRRWSSVFWGTWKRTIDALTACIGNADLIILRCWWTHIGLVVKNLVRAPLVDVSCMVASWWPIGPSCKATSRLVQMKQNAMPLKGTSEGLGIHGLCMEMVMPITLKLGTDAPSSRSWQIKHVTTKQLWVHGESRRTTWRSSKSLGQWTAPTYSIAHATWGRCSSRCSGWPSKSRTLPSSSWMRLAAMDHAVH